jgi:hypothetical protein
LDVTTGEGQLGLFLLVVLLLSFYTTFALIVTIIKSVSVIKEMIEKNISKDIKKSKDPSHVN